jgi:hypothetical protein
MAISICISKSIDGTESPVLILLRLKKGSGYSGAKEVEIPGAGRNWLGC